MKAPALKPAALRTLLPVVTIVGAVIAAVFLGIELALLIVAAGALAGVIALLWASVQSLTGEAPLTLEEALGMAAPSAEEEQKRAVLRALKDLEFERSVGKISEADYVELSERYRADARRLMRLLDEASQPNRERIEALVKERYAAARRPAANEPVPASEDEPAPKQNRAAASDPPEPQAAPREAGGEG